MKQDKIKYLFSQLKKHHPKPDQTLSYHNLYTLLVAVMLSAQMTDKGVNRATKTLFKKAKTPRGLLKLGRKEILSHLKSINYYQTKTKHLMDLSKILLEKHKGKVPSQFDDLIALPGVGRKTANVVLNVGFGEERFAVDTHIYRLSNRSGLARGKTPFEVEKQLDKTVPAPYRKQAHHLLILHGRNVCQARLPLCYNCCIQSVCVYKDKTKNPKHQNKLNP